LRHEKARFSDEKARKSTQNEAKNRCFCVWDQDVAGSNPVIPTKNPQMRLASSADFSIESDDEEPLHFAEMYCFALCLFPKSAKLSAQNEVLNPVASTKKEAPEGASFLLEICIIWHAIPQGCKRRR
jgi:hypothetical protein